MFRVSTSDKKRLLMAAGILLMVLSYVFIYRPQLQEAQQIETDNRDLNERLNQLLEMAKDKELYVQKTQEMQTKIEEYGTQFPADVRAEDGIVLAKNMENSVDMYISNVGLGPREFVYSLENGTEQQTQEERETLAEQNNQATQERLNEIEGVEESQEKTVSAETDNPASPSLYRSQDTLQFQCNYEGLKRAVNYLGTQTGRMTLNNLTASFDPATGILTGTMTVDLFSMTGMDTTYQEPDAGSVPYGTHNIFGTIEAPAPEEEQQPKEEAASLEGQETEQNS